MPAPEQKNQKRCSACSKRAGTHVFHDKSDFGPHKTTRDGFKISCRKSERIAQRARRNGAVGSRMWFRNLHAFDHGWLNDDALRIQQLFAKPWRAIGSGHDNQTF